jgi:hypothetical protein
MALEPDIENQFVIELLLDSNGNVKNNDNMPIVIPAEKSREIWNGKKDREQLQLDHVENLLFLGKSITYYHFESVSYQFSIPFCLYNRPR